MTAMRSLRTLLALLLVLALGGCMSYEQRIGAPAEPRLGPLPLSAVQLDGYSGDEEFERGVAAAQANISQGSLVFYEYGLVLHSLPRPRFERRYTKVLARHGVRFENPGCELPPPAEAAGYAHRMALEVLDRYGADFWQKVDQEARQ